MSDTEYDPPPQPGERVERREIIERVPADGSMQPRRATPMWVWVLPLVLVVIALVWFIFTRGQPRSPLEGISAVAPAESVEPWLGYRSESIPLVRA